MSETPSVARTSRLDAPVTLRVLVQAFRTLAHALYLAAALIFVGMVLMWVNQPTFGRDWPGRYWLAVVPLVFAGVLLTLRAREWEDPS